MGNISCLEHRREVSYHERNMPQSTLVCRFQADGTLTYANDLYCCYFGKQRKEIVGNSFLQFVAPEDTLKIHQHLETLRETKTYLVFDYRVIMPDRSIHRQQWTFRTLLDSEGNISEFHATGKELPN